MLTISKTIEILADRFVTPTIDATKYGQIDNIAVTIPTLDDASAVILETSDRPHRFNYPCMEGKLPPCDTAAYADNGIILEFDMDDADGTTITDNAQGLVLTKQGDPTFQCSAATIGLGKGLAFDGTGDAFDLVLTDAATAALYTLPDTGDFSVEVVFATTDTTSGTGDTIICCRDGAAGVGWQLKFDGEDHIDFDIEDSTGVTSLAGTTDVDTGSIVHAIVTLTRAGNGVIYIKGVAEGTAAISSRALTLINASADTRFAIGGDAARGGTEVYTGEIFFARVYNFALTAAQAAENYRIMMNLGYPGWLPVADHADGADLVLSASGSDPNRFALSEYPTIKELNLRAVCATEQTTSATALEFNFQLQTLVER